ncbi:PhoH family protein [bacterium]|nr:PhoH family protein [bacterium]
MKRKKLFILDTNVILHDSTSWDQFEEHDVVVPITVLEELDQFKKGHETLNYNAREFLRKLDELSGDKLFDGGIPIGPDRGRIMVKLEKEIHPDLAGHFDPRKADHQILNIAYSLAESSRGLQVVLVTKDVNLRLKAKSIGLPAQDYKTDHVKDIETLYTGSRIGEQAPEAAVDALFQEPFEIPADALKQETPLSPNEFMILRSSRSSALAVYDPFVQKMRRVDKVPAYGIHPRNAEQAFALHALLNPKIRLVTLTGKAGTGKTLLALAAALENMSLYRQIYMARPVVPLSNKDIGYLPGDIQSKLDPYMQPLYDNLNVIKNQYQENSPKHTRIGELLAGGKLVISPLAYIRGRSLVKIFFIVDEAQNLTPHEVKTIITRAGDDTKMVFTGDIFQIDHPYLDSRSNGLSTLIEKMRGQKLYAHMNLEKGERSELADLASNLL